jgi:uncharacterized protein with GYD domain
VPTYIVLENWSEQGIRTFSKSPSRLDAAIEAAARADVELREVYWTMGPYDMISVCDAPDDETISAHMLNDASKGSVRSVTVRAFNREEMLRIIEKVEAVRA